MVRALVCHRLRACFAVFVAAMLCAGAPVLALAQSIDPGLSPTLDTQAPIATSFETDDYNRGRNVAVMERDRPEYDPVGIPAGGFVVFPKLALSTVYDSNALAADGSAGKIEGDWSFVEAPALLLQSNWNRNEVDLEAAGDLRQGARFSSNDETGFSLKGLGRYDLVGTSYIEAGVDSARQYVERTENAFPLSAAALPSFYNNGLDVVGRYERDRLRLTASADAREYLYGIAPTLTGGSIDLKYRDIYAAKFDGRAEYGVSPDVAMVLEATYTSLRYPHYSIASPAQDSDEADVFAGVNFDATHLVRGQIIVGYLDRSYGNPAYKPISSVAADANLQYFPTTLITIQIQARRSVIDSIFAFNDKISPGYVETIGRIRVDYELLRNFIISASAAQSQEAYEGLQRDDSVGRYSIGATYAMNRIVSLQASLSRYSRASGGADRYRNFSGNEIFLTLSLKR